MTRASTPHEVLGIAPGADREAVEAAYRRLIKTHHPDAGGDSDKAKAIIHAYRSLTRSTARIPVVVEAPPMLAAARSRSWPVIIVASLAILLWWVPWPLPEPGTTSVDQEAGPPVAGPKAPVPVAPLLQPRVAPDMAAVEAGVEEARRLTHQSPDLALNYSRSCASDLERLPGDGLLDHCLGFDLAATARLPASPWWAPEAVATRHGEAALKVLEDPVLAEARLREIRRLVERKLLTR